MKILFNNLAPQWQKIKSLSQERINNLFSSSQFINGPDVEIFEKNFSRWNGNKYAIGVSSGTDAIRVSLQSLNLDGNVQIYTLANTFIATVFAAEMAFNSNCEIHLIDHDEFLLMDINKLEEVLIKNHSKGPNIIIPVHLYGQCCDMENILELATKFEATIVEDCSQAHGSLCENEKKVGTYGTISAFSCYPGKNLGAAGDAGVIVTNNLELAKACKKIRSQGQRKKYIHEVKGGTYRLDTLQAIILDEKLKFLDEWNERRIKAAECYEKNINNNNIIIPPRANFCKKHVYHIFALLVKKRNEFITHMSKNNIPTMMHYPIPIEESRAYKYLNQNNKKTRNSAKNIVSLPIHPFMSQQELRYICRIINKFNP